MVKVIMLTLATLVVGCANIDYQFGDISRAYCGSTSDEFRAEIKARLSEKGVEIGVDYCVLHGLVDAVVANEGEGS